MLMDQQDMFRIADRTLADGNVTLELPSMADHTSGVSAGSRVGGGVAGWGYSQRCQPWIVALVNEAYNGAQSLTLTLAYSNDNSTYVTVVTTGALAVARLTRGAVLINQAMPALPAGVKARYLRGSWDLGTGTEPNAGSLTFGIILDGLRDISVMTSVIRRRVPTSFDYFPGDNSRRT